MVVLYLCFGNSVQFSERSLDKGKNILNFISLYSLFFLFAGERAPMQASLLHLSPPSTPFLAYLPPFTLTLLKS